VTTAHVVPVLLGAGLGAVLVVLASRCPEGERRRPLAIGLVVAALIYVVYGVVYAGQQGGPRRLAIESAGLVLFSALAWLGWRRAPLWLALGWTVHVAWDIGLHGSPVSALVPAWYPPLCVGFDLIVAGYALALALDGSGRSLTNPVPPAAGVALMLALAGCGSSPGSTAPVRTFETVEAAMTCAREALISAGFLPQSRVTSYGMIPGETARSVSGRVITHVGADRQFDYASAGARARIDANGDTTATVWVEVSTLLVRGENDYGSVAPASNIALGARDAVQTRCMLLP
jgi:hypothetical protein